MEKKLAEWVYANFNFDTQKWTYDVIPDDILDCVIDVMRKEDDFESLHKIFNNWTVDFITDFIFDQIVNWKQWEITKLWLKWRFEEETADLFE